MLQRLDLNVHPTLDYSVDNDFKSQKKNFWDTLICFARAMTLEIINWVFNHKIVFRFIGRLNKRFQLIYSVFLVYPGNEKYSSAYLTKSRVKKILWDPWPSGIIIQDRKVSLMFCITSSDNDFTSPHNVEKLKIVYEKIEGLKKIFCAPRKCFAGVLPGIFLTRRISSGRDSFEAKITARAVIQGLEKVRLIESLQLDTPIIILGNRGFVGRQVEKLLGDDIYGIDKNQKLWPEHLKGRQVIVLNISLPGVLEEYTKFFWPGTVIINEVYPEPPQKLVSTIVSSGCSCYHITGVRGFAFPSFPEAYKGAIPCCAAWLSETMEVVINQLK